MSLMLRKACQEILDKHKIPNFHTAIDNRNKLSIVSECGKPFVTIEGITFNRQTPTADEIIYAAELLEDYMGTHIQTIKTFLKKQIDFNKKKEIPSTTNKFDIQKYSTHIKDKYTVISYLLFEDGIYGYKVFEKKFSKKVEIHLKSKSPSVKSLNDYKSDDKLMKDAVKYLADYLAYKQEEQDIEDLKAQLSACNI